MLHLNVEEVTRIKRFDHELWFTQFTLSLSNGLSVLQVHDLLIVSISDIVSELKTIFHLNCLASLLGRRFRLDCAR